MPKLSKEEVSHIAKLSRLELTDEEVERFSGQLSNVLEYVGALAEVDTENVEPLNNATGLSNIYVEDRVEPSKIGAGEIKQNAPEFQDGFFVVPGVFS